MPRLLLINPNTSASVTALLQSHAERFAGIGDTVHATTARFGAPYIACEASYAVAGHAALDSWAVHQAAGFDAVLIGCFGDPGLMALRECSAVPVTGLAEAAFIQAAALGPFAIVTGGSRWGPMLERLALALGFAPQLAGIHSVAQSGAELAQDPVAAQAILAAACAEAAQRFGAASIILGGAGLAGMAGRIAPLLSVPVIDSVQAGVTHALQLGARNAQVPATGAVHNRTFDFAWRGVSPELSRMGAAKVAAKDIVEEFLRVIMVPDPVAARAFVSPQLRIRFTGAREMRDTTECSAFNAGRYRWVKKRFEQTDVVAGDTADEAIVYNIGTLYGEWPDGTAFEGNRYVDRYVVRSGKIVQMDVWNDSAERMLLRAGLCEPWLVVP